MKSFFSTYTFWASALILSLVANGLATRSLAIEGVPLSISLIIRGLVCLVLVLGWALKNNWDLNPKNLKSQIFRAFLAGLSLTLYTLSYKWLSASAISVLSNVDVPLMIVLAPIFGIVANKNVRFLSGFSILFLLWYVASLERDETLVVGLGVLGVALTLLCFGYLFIKRSMGEENPAVTILTPSLAIGVFGIGEFIFENISLTTKHGGTGPLTSALIFQMCIAGISMFVAYVATMRLYGLTDLATAEFPTLLASLVIQPLELFFLGEQLRLEYFLSSLGFVLVLFLILRQQRKDNAPMYQGLNLPTVVQSLPYSCGAACFESMFQHLKKETRGELYFAEKLGTLSYGYTPPENIVLLANEHGIPTKLVEGANLSELKQAVRDKNVVFVTRWYEDAGHYSLVQSLGPESITLMDPWMELSNANQKIPVDEFVKNWKIRGSKMIIAGCKVKTRRTFDQTIPKINRLVLGNPTPTE